MAKKSIVVVNKYKTIKCATCSITIGPGYLEPAAYKVGSYKICGDCQAELQKRGHLLVEPYYLHQYLCPGGRVIRRRREESDEDSNENCENIRAGEVE